MRQQARGNSKNLTLIPSALCAVLLALCSLAAAQQAKKVPLVGILTPDPVSARINLFEAFKKGLHEVGYVEGQNIGIEVRSAEGKRDRLPTVERFADRLLPFRQPARKKAHAMGVDAGGNEKLRMAENRTGRADRVR